MKKLLLKVCAIQLYCKLDFSSVFIQITFNHKGSPLAGKANWARFGTTITNIGDINGDGYKGDF